MSAIPPALAAINTFFQRGDGLSPGTFETVANVGDIAGFDMAAAEVDVTSHSTGNPWRLKIPTLLDPGKLTIPLYYIPQSPGHQLLLNDFANRVTTDYRIVWAQSGGLFWQCQMFISGFKAEAPVAGVEKAMVTFSLTGDPILPTA